MHKEEKKNNEHSSTMLMKFKEQERFALQKVVSLGSIFENSEYTRNVTRNTPS